MRPITDVLREIRKGRVVDRASTMLAELVRAVDETEKPGELTIKLTVKPEKGGGAAKTIEAKVTSKLPLEDLPAGVFFSDADGDLHREDPTQPLMFGDAADLGDVADHRRKRKTDA